MLQLIRNVVGVDVLEVGEKAESVDSDFWNADDYDHYYCYFGCCVDVYGDYDYDEKMTFDELQVRVNSHFRLYGCWELQRMNAKCFRGFDLSRDFELLRDEESIDEYVYLGYWGCLRQLVEKVSPFQLACTQERSRLVEL